MYVHSKIIIIIIQVIVNCSSWLSLYSEMGRAPCCDKVGLKKGRWTSEEDEILIKYIQVNGEGSWRSLPKNAGIYIYIRII